MKSVKALQIILRKTIKNSSTKVIYRRFMM